MLICEIVVLFVNQISNIYGLNFDCSRKLKVKITPQTALQLVSWIIRIAGLVVVLEVDPTGMTDPGDRRFVPFIFDPFFYILQMPLKCLLFLNLFAFLFCFSYFIGPL